MLPRLHGKRLLFRLNAAPVHANHANRASAFAVSRIIDPSRLADPKAFVNPDYFASDSTKPDYALIPDALAAVKPLRGAQNLIARAKQELRKRRARLKLKPPDRKDAAAEF